MCCSGSIEKSHGIKKVTESGSAVQSVSQLRRVGNAMEGDPQQIIQILVPVTAPPISLQHFSWRGKRGVNWTQLGKLMPSA